MKRVEGHSQNNQKKELLMQEDGEADSMMTRENKPEEAVRGRNLREEVQRCLVWILEPL
jgi:K+/H+ antiporter YhaU regulatory subunit KhtT